MEKGFNKMFDNMPEDVKKSIDSFPKFKDVMYIVYKTGFMDSLNLMMLTIKDNLTL